MAFHRFAVLAFLSLAFLQVDASTDDNVRTCEPIKIHTCKGLGYNNTGMPNLAGHELQQDAELQFQTFSPLVQYGCSSQLKFFLCSVYVPMCTEKAPDTIGPCRPLCESVKTKCEPLLKEFGFLWPSALNCSKFPLQNNEQHMCMDGPKEQTKVDKNSRRPTGASTISEPSSRNHFGLCLQKKYADEYFYINRTESCAHSCRSNILFSRDNKNFADVWTLIWAALCFISTLFTLITFALKSTKVHYSERVIVFIAATYLVYSLAYFLRLAVGRDEVACHVDSQHGQSILIRESLDNVYCTTVFVVLYYFTMASMVWWVILTITWFLATGLGVSHEDIERRCSYFHAAAWCLPALKVIAILVMRLVDGDELTGTCYVGNQSKPALLAFVIVPSACYLFVGVCFLAAGLLCAILASRSKAATALRTRHGSHRSSSSGLTAHPQLLSQATFGSSCYSSGGGGQKEQDKQDTLNLRVLFFAGFYILPAACILGANIYEYVNREAWYKLGSSERPNVEVFVFKIFMSLIVGMKSGLWVWSSRTPWSLSKKRHKKQPIPSYLQVSSGGSSFIPPQQKRLITPAAGFLTLESRPPTATISRSSCSYNGRPKSLTGGETTV